MTLTRACNSAQIFFSLTTVVCAVDAYFEGTTVSPLWLAEWALFFAILRLAHLDA